MRYFASLLLLVACAGSEAPARSTSPASPGSAAPPGFACGTTTCAPEQYCMEYSIGQGAPPPPDRPPPPPTESAKCVAEASQGGGWSCTAPGADRHLHCVALVPAAPPRR